MPGHSTRARPRDPLFQELVRLLHRTCRIWLKRASDTPREISSRHSFHAPSEDSQRSSSSSARRLRLRLHDSAAQLRFLAKNARCHDSNLKSKNGKTSLSAYGLLLTVRGRLGLKQ